jgi:hypothetical protein
MKRVLALVALMTLWVSLASAATITLQWTAPGDDGNVGTATTYQMRWSASPIVGTDTLSWWNAAFVVSTGLPAPMIAGTTQTAIVTGAFVAGVTYRFMMKACDEASPPNCSRYSNLATKTFADTLAPAAIMDLRSEGTLRWTNPPGDVVSVKFYVTIDDPARSSWVLTYPLFFATAVDTVWRSRPGQADFLAFSGSCRSAPTRYEFIGRAVSSTGKESAPSNGGVPTSLLIVP